MLVLKNAKHKFRVTYNSKYDFLFTKKNTNGQDVHFSFHEDRIQYNYSNNHHITLFRTVKKMKQAKAKDRSNISSYTRDYIPR